jgi:hypothetical protein
MYGKNVTIAGWGSLMNNAVPMKIHKAQVTVISKQECEARYTVVSGNRIRLPEAVMCTAIFPFAIVASVSIN